MELRLEGTLSYIDNYYRLKIVPDDDSRRKLKNLGIDDTEVTVSLPKAARQGAVGAPGLPDDILSLVGTSVVAYVAPSKYSFVDKKRGHVSGTRLTLLDIKRAH